jgi:hypothetical protein
VRPFLHAHPVSHLPIPLPNPHPRVPGSKKTSGKHASIEDMFKKKITPKVKEGRKKERKVRKASN